MTLPETLLPVFTCLADLHAYFMSAKLLFYCILYRCFLFQIAMKQDIVGSWNWYKMVPLWCLTTFLESSESYRLVKFSLVKIPPPFR